MRKGGIKTGRGKRKSNWLRENKWRVKENYFKVEISKGENGTEERFEAIKENKMCCIQGRWERKQRVKESKWFFHPLDVNWPAALSSSSWICLTSREMCCSRSVFCCRSLCTRVWASVRAHTSTESCSWSTWTCTDRNTPAHCNVWWYTQKKVNKIA